MIPDGLGAVDKSFVSNLWSVELWQICGVKAVEIDLVDMAANRTQYVIERLW